jgi:phosphatidylglycerophosphatase A
MSWTWTATGFGLFRLFDIWKPWPISWADRHLKGGLGIMVDDLLAGGFAAVVLYLIIGMSG